MKWILVVCLCFAGLQTNAQNKMDSLKFPIRGLFLLSPNPANPIAQQLKIGLVLGPDSAISDTISLSGNNWPGRKKLHDILAGGFQAAAAKNINLLIIQSDSLLGLRQLIEVCGELITLDRPNFLYFPDEHQLLINIQSGDSRNIHERKLKSGDIIGKYNGKLMNDAERLVIPQTDTTAGSVYNYRSIDSTLSGKLIYDCCG